MKARDIILTAFLFFTICAHLLVLQSLAKGNRPKAVFTEWYSVNRYHRAGTEDYQYVIEFVFESEKDSITFIKKFERLRQ